MSPRTFYKVNPTHYLFGRQEEPEEEVRQWLLFELLSTYAIHINDIEIEKPVKVGTRTYYADIVVSQTHTPYIVIECKNRDDNAPEKGLQQAISYAKCLGAKFALYSNGKEWKVRRLLNEEWEAVPDFSVFTNSIPTKNLNDFALKYEMVKKILYWTGVQIPLNRRSYIYEILQEFFMEPWYCKSSQSMLICEAAGDLLLVAMNSSEAEYSREQRDFKVVSDYVKRKSIAAYGDFLEYCKTIGFSTLNGEDSRYILSNAHHVFKERMGSFSIDLSTLTKHCNKLNNLETNVIKMMNFVMAHLQDEWTSGETKEIPYTIMNCFLNIASPICESYFGINLPDRDDSDSWTLFRADCRISANRMSENYSFGD